MNPQDHPNQPQNNSPNPYGNQSNQPVAPQMTPEQIAQLQGFYGAQNPQNNYPPFTPQQPSYQQPAQNWTQPNWGAPQQQMMPPSPNAQQQANTFQQQQIQSTENPYTVDYLEKIAPKQPKPFWTKSKIFLISAMTAALALALVFIALTPNTDTDVQATLRVLYNLEESKNIARKYQSKIKNTDLAADNVGISTSLSSDMEIIEKIATDASAKIPKPSDRKKDKFAQEVAKDYEALDKKIEDAFLSSKMDEIYAREFGYKMVLLKSLVEKYQRSLSSKNRDRVQPIINNLDVAITKYDNFLKSAK